MKFILLKKSSFLSILVVALGVAALVCGSDAKNLQEDQLLPIIKSQSSVGEVSFPHEDHFDSLEIECVTCHHEVNAAKLVIPHEDYFDDFWIDCQICHHGDGDVKAEAQSCSNCHHDSPTNMADETLSAKVVIHKNCWKCHEMNAGDEASRSCQICHLPAPHK